MAPEVPLPIATSRGAVTPHEEAMIIGVATTISASETFYCHGKVDSLPPRPLLYYTVDETEDAGPAKSARRFQI